MSKKTPHRWQRAETWLGNSYYLSQMLDFTAEEWEALEYAVDYTLEQWYDQPDRLKEDKERAAAAESLESIRERMED